ncbi:hypothetical protein E1301_Tti018102 [Triplophysa tibetana]|uniref:TRIM8/14/16/25/29/45/65 coiled-coil region domain-containing protein n=1 Tax=Triplophysa tibetana TaxID=1572043 RepID=A0A5A9NP58_9TELE|nr:hypothetical protein E1301_Tti018102 [Triplophysa tibetana]
MMKEKQRAAQRQNEDVIKDLKEEITELKKRNIEQQQKISNTEHHLRLIQEKYQKDLSRQQKSSYACSLKFWFLVVGVLFVLSACFIQTYNHIQRIEAETIERLELSKTVISELKKRNKELDSHLRSCIAECSLMSGNSGSVCQWITSIIGCRSGPGYSSVSESKATEGL